MDDQSTYPSDLELFTVIGEDVELSCGIDTAGPVLVHGMVDGDVHCPFIEVGPLAQIAGGIEAKSVSILGHVHGSVHSCDVKLQSSARVDGQVIAEVVRADSGAFVRGRMYPPRLLNWTMLRVLSRIARKPAPVDSFEHNILNVIVTDRLGVVCDGFVFITIYGLLALDRQRTENLNPILRVWNQVLDKLKPEAAVIADLEAYKSPRVPLTIVAQDLALNCSISTDGDIRVPGDLQGDIQCRNCFVGRDSCVDGSIIGREVEVNGHVTGTITADSVVLNATAHVEGPVSFGTISSHGTARYSTGAQLAKNLKSRSVGAQSTSEVASDIEAYLFNMTTAA